MIEHKLGDVWYRYESGQIARDDESFDLADGIIVKAEYQLVERLFKVVRVTKECVYLEGRGYFSDTRNGEPKRVLKISDADMSSKRFAYPTKKQALRSLVKRKAFQEWHAQHCLDMAKAAKAKAEDMLAKGEY